MWYKDVQNEKDYFDDGFNGDCMGFLDLDNYEARQELDMFISYLKSQLVSGKELKDVILILQHKLLWKYVYDDEIK